MPIDIRSLIYHDRYVNEGTRTYSDQSHYTEAAEKYRHNSKTPHFDLMAYALPGHLMNVYKANPSFGICEEYADDGRVLFLIHPQILETRKQDPYVEKTLSMGRASSPIRVSPSSSTRTLYVKGSEPLHAVKVHFPFRVSRYGRKMRDEVVAQAIAVSAEMEENIHLFDDRFAFMREVLGVTHRNLHPNDPRGEHWGYLVRELTPFPESPGDSMQTLIPGFSLYGGDFFTPGKSPLLFDLISGEDPRNYVLEEIMFPVIRQWVSCFYHLGFLLEPHGQNMLFEIGADKEIRRIVHRDLSMGIDMRRRRDLGLSNHRLNAYNRMENGSFGSITYDKFMGNHFFDQVVACLRIRYPALKKEDFSGPCREVFQGIFPDHDRYLPENIHYFTRKRDSFGKPHYEDTGIPPEWRP